jgi:hypothetical protein
MVGQLGPITGTPADAPQSRIVTFIDRASIRRVLSLS